MTRTTRRRLLLTALTASLFAAGVPVADLLARPGMITTKDGNTISGEILEERPDAIVINARGIKTTVQRDNIQSFEYADRSVEEEFKERMDKLGEKDVAGRIELARWAFDKGNYTLARDALDSALTIDPNSREATELMESVRGQMRLEQRSAANPAAPRTPATAPVGPGGEPVAPETTAGGTGRNLLAQDQINTIRQVELRRTDTAARINVPANVRREFVERTNRQPREFNALPLLDQALAILDEGTEDERRAVRIMSDPASILEYRTRFQQTALANCATSGCHGPGTGAGGFVLFAPAENDPTTYTNFYILQTYVREGAQPQPGGPFGGGEVRMINRSRPETSLLAEYLLPPAVAEYDHPQVPGYRAFFSGRDDVRYQRLIEWIGRSLRPVDPDYGIDYTSPANRTASTQPATQPEGPPR